MPQSIGTIYKDATTGTSQNGKSYISFTLVETHSFKNKQGERLYQNTFYNCVYWNKSGLAPYLKKDTLLKIDGIVSANTYTDGAGDVKAGLNFTVQDLNFIHLPKPKTQGEVAEEPFFEPADENEF